MNKLSQTLADVLSRIDWTDIGTIREDYTLRGWASLSEGQLATIRSVASPEEWRFIVKQASKEEEPS